MPEARKLSTRVKDGGYLLSHLVGSTIGAAGLNFSVRDGKRWGTGAVATQYVSLFFLLFPLFHLAFLTASASWGG